MVFTPGMAAPRVKKLMLEGCVQEGIELRRASGYRQLPIAWETSFKLGLNCHTATMALRARFSWP